MALPTWAEIGSHVDRMTKALHASRPKTDLFDQYFEGEQTLEQLGLAIPDELRDFTVVVGWAAQPVIHTEARLDALGFRIAGASAADASLQEIWQYNNMDERQSFVHTESMALRRSYVCVGANEESPKHPLITVESAREMIAERDPRTHAVTAALRLYDAVDGVEQRATLYLPNSTHWLMREGSGWVDEFEPNEHGMGTVPVVPFVNGHRPTRRPGTDEGRSDMERIIPIADSCSRALTNLQLAQETMAVPQRAVLGATRGDFLDAQGNPMPVWASYFSSVWAHGNPNAKVTQFEAAAMSNFDSLVQTYARAAASVTPLEVEYYGLATNNPPSAEGRRAGEVKLIKFTERKQTSFGHAWESVMRLAIRVRDGAWSDDARRMETIWRDAGTPTKGQVTDAVVKQYQTGLTDWETAQEDLGRTPEQISLMKSRRGVDASLALGFGVQQVADDAAVAAG